MKSLKQNDDVVLRAILTYYNVLKITQQSLKR